MYVAASFITSRIPAQGHNITNIQGGCGDPKISELGGGAPTPPSPDFLFLWRESRSSSIQLFKSCCQYCSWMWRTAWDSWSERLCSPSQKTWLKNYSRNIFLMLIGSVSDPHFFMRIWIRIRAKIFMRIRIRKRWFFLQFFSRFGWFETMSKNLELLF